jgi:hypothetical protein
LTELSEIIAKHGKTLDISTPALGEPKHVVQVHRAEPVAPAPAPVVAAAVSLGAAAVAPVEPAPVIAPAPIARPTEPRRPANGGGLRETRPATPAQPRAEAQPKAPPPPAAPRPAPSQKPTASASPRPAAPPPPAAENEDRGWVSDLLRRASREEDDGDSDILVKPETETKPASRVEAKSDNGQNAPPAPPSGPLNVLAGDIAKAIDHDASVELWERHRRGEHNVFTRRLYTLEGQQTFDEIRKKYQRDQEFRSAVDRYIADFEKLLSEVTRNNRDRAAGNSYLVSDTGKVYTMLAHASGRFD